VTFELSEGVESWVAAISGTIGEETQDGFVLNNPNIQTFEKKACA